MKPTQLTEKTGNLLECGAEVLVNATNTRGVMGGGIALQFKERFPEMFEDYKAQADAGELNVEEIHVWRNEGAQFPEPKAIANLHTKDDYRNPSRYLYVVQGLMDLALDLDCGRLSDLRTIAIPALGCGLGGLNWEVVRPLMHDILLHDVNRDDLEVWIYPPQ